MIAGEKWAAESSSAQHTAERRAVRSQTALSFGSATDGRSGGLNLGTGTGRLPCPERSKWIHLRRTPRRHEARDSGDYDDDDWHGDERQRVMRADAVQKRRQQPDAGQR